MTRGRISGQNAVCAGSVLITVVFAILRVRSVMHTPGSGSDLVSVYRAGKAVLNGGVVYTANPVNTNDPFLYPPTCALVAALVAKLMSFHTARWFMASAEFAAILTSVYGSFAIGLRSRWWPAVASLVLIVLMATAFTMNAADLENLSLLLPPAALAVYYLSDSDHWELAMVALGLSILIKPLLAPLFLIPLLRRRFGLTIGTVIAIVVVILLAAVVTGSAGHLPRVVHRLMSGSTLVGRYAVYNVSLSGFGHQHNVVALADVLRLAVVLLFLLSLWRLVRGVTEWDLRGYAAIGTLSVVTLFLAGGLSENHYFFSLLPGVILVLLLTSSRSVQACLLVAVLVAIAPLGRVAHGDVDAWYQAQLVFSQLIVFAGLWWELALTSAGASLGALSGAARASL